MTINEKLKKIRHEFRKCTDAEKRKKLTEAHRYGSAKQKNTAAVYREEEIAKRVQKKYSIDKQIEILLNGDVGEIALLKAHRAQIATEVDQLIKQYENELNNA